MGKDKKTRKFAAVKRMLNPNDGRLKASQDKADFKAKKAAEAAAPRQVNQVPSGMFFAHNTALGPPYHIIVDTNFINFSIRNKIDIMQGMTNYFPYGPGMHHQMGTAAGGASGMMYHAG